ncbi:MAG TPA: hypothetical protein VK206_18415, partial [Anaerolineales bacterium]|nr:hypothetical protein [Anaerolineales bacterium]
LFALLVVAGIVVSIIRDQRCRKTRNLLLQWFEEKEIKAVYFDTKVMHKETSVGYFRMEWAMAEVMITEGSILAYWYFPIFGHRWYSGVTHWHLKERVIPPQIQVSIPVESLKITDGNLVVKALEKHIDVSTTFKDVTDSGQVELIRNMLHDSNVPYQEN